MGNIVVIAIYTIQVNLHTNYVSQLLDKLIKIQQQLHNTASEVFRRRQWPFSIAEQHNYFGSSLCIVLFTNK
jgi:chlorite dismutase